MPTHRAPSLRLTPPSRPMHRHTLLVLNALAVAGLATAAGAQARPPVRPLGPLVATASEPMSTVMGVRHLPDGRVLVNDPIRRRVVLFDSTLATFSTVIDSASGGANSYGGRLGGLIAWRGDSTIFVDPASLSMLMIDPSGKIGRVMSVPRSEDAMALVSAANGTPGFDAAGRLVYRAPMRRAPRAGVEQRVAGAPPAPPEFPDTSPLVRIDLVSRKLDTVAFVKYQRPNIQMTRGDDGSMSVRSILNPLPVVDDWAVLSDGSIAIVRGRDYHVDVVGPDGRLTSAPKIPFDWRRLSDEEKVALIDSVKAARARMAAAAPSTATPGAPRATGSGDAPVSMTMTVIGGPGGAPGGQVMRSGPGEVSFVDPAELPDYQPPFFAGAARADAEGKLWVRTIPTKGIAGGPVYDVLDRTGALVDQVQVPAGRTIVGFGPGGIVYLTSRDANGATILERARVR